MDQKNVLESSSKNTFANPDPKFAYAIQLVQDSYAEKVNELLEEISKWKALANKQKQQIQHFEDELKVTYQRIGEFEKNERRLHEQIQTERVEHEEIIKERNNVAEKYNALQAHLAHLLDFKKAIFETVQKDSTLSNKTLDDDILTTPSSKISTSTTYRRYTHTTASSQNGHKPTALFTSPNSSLIHNTRRTNGQSSSVLANAGEHSDSSDELTKQAADLYAQIKANITAEEFKSFAENVNKLNNNIQSAEQTLENVRKIVKDPSLFKRFEKLIQDAQTQDS